VSKLLALHDAAAQEADIVLLGLLVLPLLLSS
jgi:hypothetical protein